AIGTGSLLLDPDQTSPPLRPAPATTPPDRIGDVWDHRRGGPPSPAGGRHGGGFDMATTRRATPTWSAALLSGRASVTAATTGIFRDQPTTWAARTTEPDGLTSPEELLAAAHAACFSMACSNILAKAGTPPTRLDVEVAISADKLEAGFTVTNADIVARGVVPGAPQESFAAAASEAKDGCPISRALKGNVALTVEAHLEGCLGGPCPRAVRAGAWPPVRARRGARPSRPDAREA